MAAVGFVIRYYDKVARFVALQDGILAGLCGVFQFLEFILGHILRIEVGAGGFGTETGDEGFLGIQTVPCTILYLGKLTHIGVFKLF